MTGFDYLLISAVCLVVTFFQLIYSSTRPLGNFFWKPGKIALICRILVWIAVTGFAWWVSYAILLGPGKSLLFYVPSVPVSLLASYLFERFL